MNHATSLEKGPALPSNNFSLGQERDTPWQQGGQDQRLGDGLMVGSENHRARPRYAASVLDTGSIEQPDEWSDDKHLQERVHGGLLESRVGDTQWIRESSR